jgi:hypothetical protein
MVAEATEWLLGQQGADGSWTAIWHPDDPLWPKSEYDRIYFAIHPTVQTLPGRAVQRPRRFSQ